MITEERMLGAIDQVGGFLEFSEDTETLLTWDDSIQSICLGVNATVDHIAEKYPETVKRAGI